MKFIYLAALVLCFASSFRASGEEIPVMVQTSIIGATDSKWEISALTLFGSDSEQNSQLIGDVLTVRQSFQVIPLGIRYKSSYRDALCLEIPYIWRSQELRFGADSIKLADSGVGDVRLGFERRLRRAKLSGWDGILGINVTLPTGRSVYSCHLEDELPMGTGHYQTGFTLDFCRIADPIVTNFGFGIDYTHPRSHDGIEIKPGFGLTLRSGIAYALNDRWVLTEQMDYSRKANVLIQNITASQTEMMDQAYITNGLIYNSTKSDKTYLLRFSLGLNNASTDYILSFGIQWAN